jgi:hypothetical protein
MQHAAIRASRRKLKARLRALPKRRRPDPVGTHAINTYNRKTKHSLDSLAASLGETKFIGDSTTAKTVAGGVRGLEPGGVVPQELYVTNYSCMLTMYASPRS